jgi:hypothetical protein
MARHNDERPSTKPASKTRRMPPAHRLVCGATRISSGSVRNPSGPVTCRGPRSQTAAQHRRTRECRTGSWQFTHVCKKVTTQSMAGVLGEPAGPAFSHTRFVLSLVARRGHRECGGCRMPERGRGILRHTSSAPPVVLTTDSGQRLPEAEAQNVPGATCEVTVIHRGSPKIRRLTQQCD